MRNLFKRFFSRWNSNNEAKPNFEHTQTSPFDAYISYAYSSYDNTSAFPYDLKCKIFIDNLNVTKAYCDLQLKNHTQSAALVLRSFNPIIKDKKLFEFEYIEDLFKRKQMLVRWTTDPLTESLIHDLFDQQLIYKSNIISNFSTIEKINGKVLIANFDETVLDGASEACSEGFIDIFDLPPIDTWFYLNKHSNDNGRVYAWIPTQFEDIVNEAITVNCMDCLYWLEETEQQ